MRKQYLTSISKIVIHTSATLPGRDVTAQEIDGWHKAKGWAMIGYHTVIRLDGTIERGRDYGREGAHVKGHNAGTLGICMVGGLNDNGDPACTYNDQQWHALFYEIHQILRVCPNVQIICGHRDMSPDTDDSGTVESDEWLKSCPCFSVKKMLTTWGMSQYIAPWAT